MTEIFEWAQLRARAYELFDHETVSPTLEAEIVRTFEQFPRALEVCVERIGAAYKAGTVRSPWAVLGTEAIRMREAAPAASTDGEDELEAAERKAAALIRNAGHMIDEEAELEAVLYERGGPLELFANDDELRPKMLELWKARRA